MMSRGFEYALPIPRPITLGGWLTVAVLALLVVASPATAKKKPKVGELNGRVLDQAGQMLDQATVWVSGGGFSKETKSDGKGEFQVQIVDATGEYLVRIEREGFTPFETTLPLEVGDQQNIDFRLVDIATGNRQKAVEEYNAGVRAFNTGQAEEALRAFAHSAELDPQLAEPLLGLTDLHIQAERFAEAVATAEKFLALRPDDSNARRLLYEAVVGLGDEERAKTLRSELGGSDQAQGLAVQTYNEGAVATQRGDLDTAVAKFSAALELDPDMTQALVGLSTVYYNQQEFDLALDAAEKLLAREPDSVQGRRIRYLVHDARNDRDQIDAVFEAYAEVDPTAAADALYQRADLDFRSGEIDSAQQALRRVLELAPNFARAHYTLGLTYAQGDPAKARQHLEKFIELAPDDPEVTMARSMLEHF